MTTARVGRKFTDIMKKYGRKEDQKPRITARGKDMGGYHLNPVTAWLIERDGQVLFKPEKWK